jgi:integrase
MFFMVKTLVENTTNGVNLNVFPCIKRAIEGDESLRRLAARVYRRGQSEKSVMAYVQSVVTFARWLKVTPSEALRSRHDWPGVVNEFIDHLVIEKKTSGGTVHLYVAAVKKWLTVNDVEVNWKAVEPPKIWRVERDRLLAKEELRQILNGADLASRVMVLALLSSGLRVGALTRLKLKDIKMEYDYPLVIVGPEISKTREGYVTFMTPEAKTAIQQYLKERELNGEVVGPESPLIVKERPRGTPITEVAAMQRWHKLLKMAGKAVKGRKWYEAHIHTLRKYFKSWASLSGVPEALVEALMGHRKGIQQTYFLPGLEAASNHEVVKRVLAEYQKALPALTIFSEEEKVKQLEVRIEEQKRTLEAERGKFEEEKSALAGRLRLLEEAVADLKKLAG